MSPSVSIRRRQTAKGKPRFQVRYRLGGRGYKLIHAGSFTTLKEARARRDLVAGEIAAGRNPQLALAKLKQPVERDTWLLALDRFAASRHDVGTKAKEQYRHVRARLGDLADLEPAQTTVAHLQAWIAAQVDAGLAPRTVAHYFSTLRQISDFLDLQPNPARSPRIRLPREPREEVSAPSGDEWAKIRARLTGQSSLVLRLCECVGLRISEATELRWGDVDLDGSRLRISRARTKGRTAGQRWLPVPDQLIEELEQLCPLEDRDRDRTVFRTADPSNVRKHLSAACKLAGTAHYSPHDLRHRRISLWVAAGIDPVTVKTWAGHARASISLDVYAHVLAGGDEWRDFWIGVYREERLPQAEREGASRG